MSPRQGEGRGLEGEAGSHNLTSVDYSIRSAAVQQPFQDLWFDVPAFSECCNI